jgi:hypothetical protein
MSSHSSANAARRKNARKSTGPKSAGGKARSAQNARRHGLSNYSAPYSETLKLYCQLLNDPSAEPPALEGGEREWAAWRLAEAELWVAAVHRALDDLVVGLRTSGQGPDLPDPEALSAVIAARARLTRYRNAAWRAHSRAIAVWQAHGKGQSRLIKSQHKPTEAFS